MTSLRKLCTGTLGVVIGVTSVIIIPLAAASPAGATGTGGTACTPETGFTNCVRYTATDADQSFTVPTGVESVRVKLWGAGGGGAEPSPEGFTGGGGGGGFTAATLAVTPLAGLSVMVGEQGHADGTTTTYGGGAPAGTSGISFLTGGSGGGMSAVFSDSTDATPLLIAGGGGGAAAASLFYDDIDPSTVAGGGGGGGLTGTGGSATAYYGGPGTQLAGGDAATLLDTDCTSAASPGSSYTGGSGGAATANNDQSVGGGGGGGGYFGGGGGACAYENNQSQQGNGAGAGGGGSAYVGGTGVTDAVTTAGASALGFDNAAASGGASDPLYDAGTGQGGTFQNGGDGEIVVEWNVPAAPTALALTSHGTGLIGQTAQVDIPDGGSATLLDGSTATDTISVQGEGSYLLDPNSGVIFFTPAPGFIGAATGVTYEVTDAFGQTTTATYIPTVSPAPIVIPHAVVASATTPTAMMIATQAQTLPVTCRLTVRKLGRCDVTLVYRNTRGSYVVGTGSITSTQAGGTAGQLITKVTLNAVGHYIAGIAPIPTWVYASITPYGSRTALPAVTRTVLENSNLK